MSASRKVEPHPQNVARGIALPWVSFASDAKSMAVEGAFLESSTHLRAYGNFARVLGRYVRGEKVIALPEAIRKLSKLPASNLKLRDCGELAAGYFADMVVFDPPSVSNHASFSDPNQFSARMAQIIVNREVVIRDGENTGALPGQIARGQGWRGWQLAGEPDTPPCCART